MHQTIHAQFQLREKRSTTALPRLFAAFAFASLIWALTARMTGPCDLWDQSQYKTVSYTTDIIVNGGNHWILPIEAGQLAATKPPLYNWMAVPFVRAVGFESELAHKMPSVLALIACWAIVVGIGQRIDDRSMPLIGWMAGMILPANYMMFKLGYLARPDMLLTLWLTLAWAFATVLMIRARASAVQLNDADNSQSRLDRWLAAGFWGCLTLAFLTKGPAVLVGLAFLVAAKPIGGSWTALRAVRPVIGLIITTLIAVAWVYGAWSINPAHVREVLVFAEFWGRVTGTGPEGSHGDWRDWLIALPNQLFYFSVRFAPWSLCTLIAVIMLWWNHRKTRRKPETQSDIEYPLLQRMWLGSSALYIGVVIGLYTLSAGKRADYVAAAFPPAALLAAWCMTRAHHRLGIAWLWIVPTASTIALAALTWVNRMQTEAPSRTFSHDVSSFIAKANCAVNNDPAPIYFCSTGENHLQAMFGVSYVTNPLDIVAANRRRETVWVVVGHKEDLSGEFETWFREQRPRAIIELVSRTPRLAKQDGWPEQLTLYKIGGRRPTPASLPNS